MPSRPKPIPGGGGRGRKPKRVKGTNSWQGWYKDKSGKQRYGFIRVHFRETYTKRGTRLWRGPDGTPISGDAVARIKATRDAQGRRRRIERVVGDIKTIQGQTPVERMQVGQRVWRQRVYREMSRAEEIDNEVLTFRQAASRLKLRRPADDMQDATNRVIKGWRLKIMADQTAVITDGDVTFINRYSGEEITGKRYAQMKERQQYEQAVWWIAGWNGITYAEARARIKNKYHGDWRIALKGDSPGNKSKK